MSGRELSDFLAQQLLQWPEVAIRFRQLQTEVQVRQLTNDRSINLFVQWNPARIVSTKATTEKGKLLERPCFLCAKNQVKKQFSIPYVDETRILINPFPILPGHIVVAKTKHEIQTFDTLSKSLYQLVAEVHEYVFFYNGARAGASAPDHAHFQGGLRGYLPLERDFSKLQNSLELLDKDTNGVELLCSTDYPSLLYVVRSKINSIHVHRNFVERFLHTLPYEIEENEANFNLFAWQENSQIFTIIFPRSKHRPNCFFAKDEQHCLVSPGAIDMAGLLITPREEDFHNITSEQMENILTEVGGFPRQTFEQEPKLRVGLINTSEIHVFFHTPYICDGKVHDSKYTFRFENDHIVWTEGIAPYLDFHSINSQGCFTIKNITIGIGFHWEQEKTQTFQGDLSIIIENQSLTAINHIGTEAYLQSVISSEMNADAPFEFLKAHAVISRSWVICQLERRGLSSNLSIPSISNEERRIWYDNHNHLYYDICADDHCQRYQGLKHKDKLKVMKAIQETEGEVLWDDSQICDARFHKCCGGITELFSTCWEDKDFSYLTTITDSSEKGKGETSSSPDLRSEEKASKWISQQGKDFCNTEDKDLLSKLLNDFDLNTNNFYRWKILLSQAELQNILQKKLGCDLGEILELRPLKRGKGGRIKRLSFIGSKNTLTVGKELEIRRLLSPSHLYSSAFIIKTISKKGASPSHFLIHGAGWGHGVGLCQIGAAVMACNGYSYQEILKHYYHGAKLKKLYEHQL